MTIKTPEQLEDAAIADAIRTLVALEMREKKREIENHLISAVKPQVDKARLEGRSVDVRTLVQRLFKEHHDRSPNN